MMWWHGGHGWGGALGMALGMIAFSSLIVAFAVVIVGWLRRDARDERPDMRRDPLDLLDERFARGEIDPEDYQARRALLRSGR